MYIPKYSFKIGEENFNRRFFGNNRGRGRAIVLSRSSSNSIGGNDALRVIRQKNDNSSLPNMSSKRNGKSRRDRNL